MVTRAEDEVKARVTSRFDQEMDETEWSMQKATRQNEKHTRWPRHHIHHKKKAGSPRTPATFGEKGSEKDAKEKEEEGN